MARVSQAVIDLLAVLFDTGFAEVVGDRPLAVALYRAARDGSDGWLVRGSVCYDLDGTAIYSVTADPPLCEGGCGGRTPTGLCYQCACEAHADGWYNMDTGRVRMETDEQAHCRMDYEARVAVRGY